MGYMIYNGQTEQDCHLVITKRPAPPSAERRYRTASIPGRDGDCYEEDGTVEDIEIEVELGFKTEAENWAERYRRARRWLFGSGDGRLFFTDDPDYFYKVKTVIIKKVKRPMRRLGELLVIFTCEGYQYLVSGTESYSVDDVSYNPYDVSHPVYKITGEGRCVFVINGHSMVANIGQNLTIDTELMLAYKEDKTLQNTAVSGDYEGLYLLPGDNAIFVSDEFEVQVIPNWRCRQ